MVIFKDDKSQQTSMKKAPKFLGIERKAVDVGEGIWDWEFGMIWQVLRTGN